MENITQFTCFQVAHPDSSVVNATSGDCTEYEKGLLQLNLRKSLKILSLVIYSTTFVLGVIGNGLVIFITGLRMKKTVNTVWFLNLAIADFTFTSFLPLSIAYLAQDFHWPFGEAMCKFTSTMAIVNLYASVFLLTVISIDRCISVLCPVWAQNHRNPRCASFVVLGVWILALVLSSPYFHFRKTEQNKEVINCYMNYSHDTEQAIVISRFIFAFVIPFPVIVFCYGAIVLRLRRDRLAWSSKPFKVITAVIVAFFVCWLPYHVFSFLEIPSNKSVTHCLAIIVGIPLTFSLAGMNSCLNPILYAFMGHDFKEGLKRSILSIFENAFAEEESQGTTQTKARASEDLDSQDL